MKMIFPFKTMPPKFFFFIASLLSVAISNGYSNFDSNDLLIPFFWVRADSLTHLTDGVPVTVWIDEGSGKHNLSLPDEATAPTYQSKTNGSKGILPAVRFAGLPNEYLSTKTEFNLSDDSGFTIIYVANITHLKDCSTAFNWGSGDTPQTLVSLSTSAGIAADRFNIATGQGADVVTPKGSYSPYLNEITTIVISHQSGQPIDTLQISYNDVKQLTAGPEQTFKIMNTPLRIGAQPDYGTSVTADVYEIMIYDRALTSTEIKKINSYLYGKYPTEGDKDAMVTKVSQGRNMSDSADYYVSPQGRDTHSGTIDKPFKTLTRARDAVRQLKQKQGLEKSVMVMVRDGRYFLDETFVLEEQDGGTRQFPVIYSAYPGERPILSGGHKIIGWEKYKDKILKAALPGAKGGNIRFRQLFLNGERQTRSRWPNYDSRKENSVTNWASSEGRYANWAKMEGPAEPGSHNAFKYKPDTFLRSYVKPHLAEVNVMPGLKWCNNIVSVASIDEQNRVVTLARDIWHSDADFLRYARLPFQPDNPFVMENLLEELDVPGEWCLDFDEGIVYFWPPEELTEESDVIFPVLDCLVDLQGTSYVTFSGFTFTETTTGDNYHRFGLEGYGAMFPIEGWKYCGEAVHLKNAAYCTIENNRFSGVGGNAVYLEGCNLHNKIRRNEIFFVGANGICLLGTEQAHPMFNEITDNHIDRCGSILMYVAGIFAGLSNGNLIAHNNIHDVPHHAVNLATNGYGRNFLEYNVISRTCTKLFDNGAVNSWMDRYQRDGKGLPYVVRSAERAGHIIRYNMISESGLCFYLDDWTSNCYVYGNVVVDAGCFLLVHGGKNNIIQNNLMIDCPQGLFYANDLMQRPENQPEMLGFGLGNHFLNNIYYNRKKVGWADIFHLARTREEYERMDKEIGFSDYNLFFDASGRYQIYDDVRGKDRNNLIQMNDWVSLGYEQHSIIEGDPLFADQAKNDFHLKPESPALKLGFQPIDMSKVGIRHN